MRAGLDDDHGFAIRRVGLGLGRGRRCHGGGALVQADAAGDAVRVVRSTAAVGKGALCRLLGCDGSAAVYGLGWKPLL